MQAQKLFPGVYRLSFGEPETFTPETFRSVAPSAALKNCEELPCPFAQDAIAFRASARGCVAELPLDSFEQLYGFGLQLKSFAQMGKKKALRVNADPVADTGDSHAPVPFYVSTSGYGVLAESARQVSFYCGANEKLGAGGRTVTVEIPAARGISLVLFAGKDPLDVVRRYNLFSGGGAMPPAWGLGVWYRCYGQSAQADAEGFAREFRAHRLPVTVLGLEPGWHTRAYSCSYIWNEKNFPDHETFLARMKELGYQINLWEHIFVHPEAEIYDALKPYAGEYEVFQRGLIPDVSLPEARDIFADHHYERFVSQGISGFKLDECDGSDYTGGWSYPDCARFPSGLDGEQMHALIGLLYQNTVRQAFAPAGKRTWGLVRASGALASPSPFTLYSDLYDHRDFIRGLANMGFSGLLWTPEVRSAASAEDLVRRIQTVIFSPVAMVNAWPFPNPPWHQVDEALNHQGIRMEGSEALEARCRRWFELRMELLPYLYTAFRRYRDEGIPPVRALLLDDPADEDCWTVENAVLVGDALYFAPLVAGERERAFYLPRGTWVNFFDDSQFLEGGREYRFAYDLDAFPLYVKAGTLLPLAKAEQSVAEHPLFTLCPRSFGAKPGETLSYVLYEDDGASEGQTGGEVTLTRQADGTYALSRTGETGHQMYRLAEEKAD
ncbi:MAG: glycoside hydrolase [Oscillospiraceae bacterium]|jgi:alpha-D-xyloside xylohydrolase|nr:glycoside hydrolase [Oscillospiraceae bacterium]